MQKNKNNCGRIITVIKLLIILILIVISGFLYSCGRENEGSEIFIDQVSGNSSGQGAGGNTSSENESSDSGNESAENSSDDLGDSTSNLEDTRKYICVHITGYVVNPGVYHIAEGARIYEVVQLAGGFLPEADESYLNLASVVFDGQKLQVLSKEEAVTAKPFIGQTESETVAKLININVASKEELMQLPGIGESRALSIIAYREKNGGFKDIKDIMKISGIKEAAFEKIKDYICTE
ncbi:MAG: helix-hairpin-helix domain-containing protein [Lachnospiraceae bacterium]|nr:helix-hairpin-helix domain-containing protein [Lachnospiraceae bacterium]